MLLVTADDYGIGPETSRAIRELGALGRVTSTVLLVNSPHAESDIAHWHRAGKPVEMGWHPNLTMDDPILPAHQVPSLLDRDGKLLSLGLLGRRLLLGQVRGAEILAELTAQYQRYLCLVGHPPRLVNGHKHIHVFPRVGAALRELLGLHGHQIYLRRLGESFRMLRHIPGARVKRVFLSVLGSWAARKQRRQGLLGNDILAGISDPVWVSDPKFFARWLSQVPGQVVELMVHPGHYDETLIGRDCTLQDGGLQRRVDEWNQLSEPAFLESCRLAGFRLVTADEVLRFQKGSAHAA